MNEKNKMSLDEQMINTHPLVNPKGIVFANRSGSRILIVISNTWSISAYNHVDFPMTMWWMEKYKKYIGYVHVSV